MNIKRPAVLIDLDRTLCNNSRRLYLIQEEPRQWKEYNSRVKEDTVNEWCADLMFRYRFDHALLILSGRPEKCRQDIMDWFAVNRLIYDYMWLRPDGDYRADVEVKRDIYRECIKPMYDVRLVLDDRRRNIEMFAEEGLQTLRCAVEDF